MNLAVDAPPTVWSVTPRFYTEAEDEMKRSTTACGALATTKPSVTEEGSGEVDVNCIIVLHMFENVNFTGDSSNVLRVGLVTRVRSIATRCSKAAAAEMRTRSCVALHPSSTVVPMGMRQSKLTVCMHATNTGLPCNTFYVCVKIDQLC